MKTSVLPILAEWSDAAAKGGFVPDDCASSSVGLSAFITGVHHGLSLAGARDSQWAMFSAWLTSEGLAHGNESPLDALVRLSPEKPLDLIGRWISQFSRRGQ